MFETKGVRYSGGMVDVIVLERSVEFQQNASFGKKAHEFLWEAVEVLPQSSGVVGHVDVCLG